MYISVFTALLQEHSKGVEWQFRLDRRSLGVLHLKAIARVYGDYGHEMLEVRRKCNDPWTYELVYKRKAR